MKPYTPVNHKCYCGCELFRKVNKVQAPQTRPQTYSICSECGAEVLMWGNPLGYADLEQEPI